MKILRGLIALIVIFRLLVVISNALSQNKNLERINSWESIENALTPIYVLILVFVFLVGKYSKNEDSSK